MSSIFDGRVARFPPKLVLVPVDFSEASSRAWAYARRIARTFGARVEALHVKPFLMGPELVIPRPIGARERRELKAVMARAYPGADALNLTDGDVLLGILRTSDRRGADLLVMATGGRRGLKRVLLPSLTEDVVRSSPVPVLAVHGEVSKSGPVLAPVNSEPYSIEGLRVADKVARALDLGLTALYVRERGHVRPLASAKLELEVGRLRSPIPIDVEVDSGDPVEKILEHGARHGLIVMVAHRKGLFHDLVLGSTAEQVLRRAQIPVLTVPPAQGVQGRGPRQSGRHLRAIRGASARTSRLRADAPLMARSG